ncbi:hypothetical protein DSO57_1012463 [Entomophthora muscae]|uniref:Uncharacterized protein n=1 Tax=Entomophthora muscae TaxID=34485 RepID=A0ACC2RX42_9FUNG|nr:hypothetical protein DSO57_1012463 [Entomophthora muscae]
MLDAAGNPGVKPQDKWYDFAEGWLNKQIEKYGSDEIAFSDKSLLVETLAYFFEGGISSFHIVSDFDATLTKYWVSPGVKFVGGHNILGLTDCVSPEFISKLGYLEEKFVNYETSLNHTVQEKSSKLVEWYEQVYQVFIDEGLTRDDLAKMVSQVHTLYREGTKELISLSEAKQIPLMICSAGISDIIDAILRFDGLLKENAIIVSNKMVFATQAPFKLTSFKKPYIHVYNKGDMEIPLDSKHFKACVPRKNLILLGDSLGDVNMGVRLLHTNILKVGLLNYDVERLLPHYLEAFDVVLAKDTHLSFVNTLLQELE